MDKNKSKELMRTFKSNGSVVIAFIVLFVLLSVFTKDIEAIEIGRIYMKYLLILIFLDNIMDTGGALLRGLNHSWLPMVVTLLGVCVFRIVWVYTYFESHHTLEGLLLSYPVSWIITLTIHYINLFISIMEDFTNNKFKNTNEVLQLLQEEEIPFKFEDKILTNLQQNTPSLVMLIKM